MNLIAQEEDKSHLQESSVLLLMNNVSKYFRDKKGKILTAVDGVSINVERDQVVALVGESGSGKTTLGRLASGLISANKGEIIFDGQPISKYKRKNLWKMVQYIHQDPYSALDPYLTVAEVLDRPLKYLADFRDSKERRDLIESFIQNIGMEHISPQTKIRRLSGGERQRVLVARSFILQPKFVAADEPTTMVDFIHRNEIIELLQKLRQNYRTSILFITHDLSLASYLADYIAIMYRGSIVEYGPSKKILEAPLHPYTQALFSVTPDKLASADSPKPAFRRSDQEFVVPRDNECKYVYACQYAQENCRRYRPILKASAAGHDVACFLHIAPSD